MGSPPPARQGRGARRTLWKAAQWVLVAAVGAALARVVVQDAGRLGSIHLRLDAPWLGLAGALTVAQGFLLVLGWRALLGAYGVRIEAWTALRVWWRSQAGRYVPTGALAVASRELLASRAGVPASLGALSGVTEICVLAAWGGLGAAVALPPGALAPGARLAVAAGTLAVLAGLPWVLRGGGRLLPRRLLSRFPELASPDLAACPLYGSLALYGGSVLAGGAAFATLGVALAGARPGQLPALGGAILGASVVGMAGVTPAGLGVREALVAVILGPLLGFADALALGIAWRAWNVAFELTWLAAGLRGALVRRGARSAAGAAGVPVGPGASAVSRGPAPPSPKQTSAGA